MENFALVRVHKGKGSKLLIGRKGMYCVRDGKLKIQVRQNIHVCSQTPTAMTTPLPLPMSLRPKCDAHPGQPDTKGTRRTPAQVRADNAAKEQAKMDKDAKRKETIQKTGQMEAQLRQDQADKLNAHNPPTASTMCVLRKRPSTPGPTELGECSSQ